MPRTQRFYTNHLQRYFDEYYGEHDDYAEYYVDPAPNQWKFYIPSLGKLVLLTCDDNGEITEIIKDWGWRR